MLQFIFLLQPIQKFIYSLPFQIVQIVGEECGGKRTLGFADFHRRSRSRRSPEFAEADGQVRGQHARQRGRRKRTASRSHKIFAGNF